MTTPPDSAQEKPTITAEMMPASVAATASAPSAVPAVAAETAAKPIVPAIGSRIEVLWQLESAGPDGELVCESRWWGAVVQAAEREVNGIATHILLYDGYGEFAEDVARVHFIDNGMLTDLARTEDEGGGKLHWRMEGSSDEVSEDPVSMVDVVQEHMMMDTADGVSMTAAGLAALETLPAEKQLRLVSGYRAFADRVKGMLAEIANDKGAGYVVTDDDIQNIFRTLQAEGGAAAAAAAPAMPPGAQQ